MQKIDVQRKRIALTAAFILGALSALSMAPLNWWPVLFITVSGLYTLLHKTNTIPKAALIGLFFGFGYFGFSLYWIGNALLVEGNPYRWAWPLAVCGLPLMLAPFWAMACALIKKINHLDHILGFTAFCLVFTISEWLRGHLFTGFPWNLFGYTWAGFSEIAQAASLYNIYLLTLLTIFWSGIPAFILLSRHKNNKKVLMITFAFLSFLSVYFYGAQKLNNATQSPDGNFNFILIQPNIKQNEKWDPEIIVQNFMDMIKQSANESTDPDHHPKATYIIWPETAMNSGLLATAWARTAIADMLATYPEPAYLISGAQRYTPEDQHFFNSIVIFDKKGEIINTYDKSHLVPFGEYMPLSSIFDIAPVVGFTGFQKGNGATNITLPEGLRFSPLICYEIIFPGAVIANNEPKPDIIINVTNDAWYGFSPGPYQHLVQAQFRAIETGIPVIRVANTGFSAVIGRNGDYLHTSKLFDKSKIVTRELY